MGEERQWRVRRDLIVVKVIALVAVVLLLVTNLDDRRAMILTGVLVLALAVLLVRDVLVPVRMAADEHGVTVVRGFSGRDHIPWSDVERVTVDVRHRYGRRWEHMEIDTGERIYLLSSAGLGTSCTEAAAELRGLKLTYGSQDAG